LASQGQAIASASADGSVLPVEIAFLQRHGVDASLLRRAADAARRSDSFADEALLKLDLLDEPFFYRALAAEIGVPFLDGEIPVAAQARFPYSLLIGLAPLSGLRAGNPRFVLAPAGERVAWLLRRERALAEGFAVTTPSALKRAMFRVHGAAIAARAANGLADADPQRSYRDRSTAGQKLAGLAIAAILLGGALADPGLTLSALVIGSGVMFLGMVALRLGAVREHVPTRPNLRPARRRDDALPVYTIIVPLRRERRVLSRLIAAIEALDYPQTKKDAKLVIEVDDREMADALATSKLPGYVEVIVAPPGEPRTKPRALNIALPLARGEFVTVYDAEDVPDRDQLRLAVATFARAPPSVACLQARLVIDNTDDNWLTRFFTIEYATLFDVINPGLALGDLPVPLGGTSNHFRRSALEALHGWDPWNVTEDADLGVRLALAGYRVFDLPSATLEEAPGTFRAWRKQRQRWMKGFMQVVVAHSRRPLAAFRALGPVRFFAAVAMTLGTVATALGYSLFMVMSIIVFHDGGWLRAGTLMEALTSAMGVMLFGAGLVAMIAPAVVAIERRGWRRLYPLVPLLPFYYALVSVAAWAALAELIRDPFGWNKTEHGLARTSRSGLLVGSRTAGTRRAAVELAWRRYGGGRLRLSRWLGFRLVRRA
jgi:glycosyltransferase XagB